MKWTNVATEGYPFDGQLVALKLTDADGNVAYGIGWWDGRQKQWVITAQPNGEATNVHSWCALPN
jgi:hypothetical protein